MPNQTAKGKKRFFLTLTEEKVNQLREYQKASGIEETLSEIMERQIRKILAEMGGNITQTAEKLAKEKTQ